MLRLQFHKKLPFHDLNIDYTFEKPVTAMMGASGSGKSLYFSALVA